MTVRVIGGTTYNQSYNAENRLISISGGTSASFVYDGDGNRVKGTAGWVTTTYIGNLTNRHTASLDVDVQAGNRNLLPPIVTPNP
jgi:YD repeat-containing protein